VDLGPGAPAKAMLKRWIVYLTALGCSMGLYVAVAAWWSWALLLTVAALPLVSVAQRLFGKGEYDSLGLFRFPVSMPEKCCEQRLRSFRLGDSPSRVHWKLTAKTGVLTVREEWEETPPKKALTGGFRTVLLCILTVLCFFPPGKYHQQLAQLQKLLRPVEQMAYVDLTAIGPVGQNKQAVMDVVSSVSQTLYLRGQAYDRYDGRRWQAVDWKDAYWPESDAQGAATVQVATRNVERVLYVPYYIAGEDCGFARGCLENADGLREYTYRQSGGGVVSARQVPKQCLQLPKETEIWAKNILDKLFVKENLTQQEKVEIIQDFVRNCAKYDKNAPQMSGQEDFAGWFLKSGRGYCVHFATAAAVLLRCAGIPARFVTGYAVQVQAGVRKTVVGDDAHAWVEYLAGGVWCVLEATPTAQTVPPAETEIVERDGRKYGSWGLAIVVIFAVLLWRQVRWRPDPQWLRLAQKAAYSRYGLTPEEEQEFEELKSRSGSRRK